MVVQRRAKLFRDPVHDTIDWKGEGRVGRLVCSLIDQPEFQRLRFIRQLGLASYVFAGAEHSRFVHSIGVAHVARRMLRAVEPEAAEDVRMMTIAAALLHDVGHGPFSHVLERVFSFRHEALSQAIIESPRSGVHRVLANVDPTLPGRVAGLIAGHGAARYGHIVSSQLDADRFDYLLRDVTMTGVVVGRFDLERILVLLRADDEGLLVDRRGWEAVEGYLLARYHMYRLVYFHRTVRAAETMLELLFKRARLVVSASDPALRAHPALRSLWEGTPVDPDAWSGFSEYHAWALIDGWRSHSDSILALLASGLLDRRLLKAVDRSYENDVELKQELEHLERIEQGLSPDELFLFALDEARHSTYQPYVARHHGGGQPIRVVDRMGRIEPIEQVSPIVRTLGQTATRLRRWYVHPLIVEKVRTITGVDI